MCHSLAWTAGSGQVLGLALQRASPAPREAKRKWSSGLVWQTSSAAGWAPQRCQLCRGCCSGAGSCPSWEQAPRRQAKCVAEPRRRWAALEGLPRWGPSLLALVWGRLCCACVSVCLPWASPAQRQGEARPWGHCWPLHRHSQGDKMASGQPFCASAAAQLHAGSALAGAGADPAQAVPQEAAEPLRGSGRCSPAGQPCLCPAHSGSGAGRQPHKG